MNQILYVQDKRNSQPVDIKKIVLFFAISILLFGLILLGQGAYSIYQNKANEGVNPNPPGSEPVGQEAPKIELTQTEDNKVKIKIASTNAIAQLVYQWNNEASQTIEEDGKTDIEEILDIPAGENTLNLSVIDVNGIETKQSQAFVIDISKPNIDLSVVGNNIKITVTSETPLSTITYQWNSQEEKREDMATYEDKTKFEKELEIPKGQNTLKITAVDSNGTTSEKSQEIRGVTKAKTVVVAQRDYLDFTVTGEENIKTVEFVFNGNSFVMNTDTFGQTKVVHYRLKMVEGMNYLKIVSTTQSGAVDITKWKYEYKTR